MSKKEKEGSFEAGLQALCTRLGEPKWACAERMDFLKAMKSLPPVSFKYGSGVSFDSGIDFENPKGLIPTAGSVRVTHSNADLALVEMIQGPGLGILGEEVLALFRDTSDSPARSRSALLNSAFTNNVLLIKVKESARIDKPVILDLHAGSLPQIASVFILAGANSSSSVIFRLSSSSSPDADEGIKGYFGLSIKALAGKGSDLKLINLQNLGQGIVFFDERKADVMKDARVDWFELSLGSGYANNSIISNLKEENASTVIKTLFAGSRNQMFDVCTAAYHEAARTRSDLLSRGVVNDEAKALSRGMISIGDAAFGSEGYERQDALLLCDRSEADAIPNLEIRNHDVKCSHGSTVGQLDSEKIFYLLSRGINFEDAKRLMIKGFFAPTLELLPDEAKSGFEKSLDATIIGGFSR
ncbi:SufD family Fe-S cluster assembly protein [Candidatus Woesearchaeota archaeon]|nr:SufD family Fe-S cluster assembly protein [Candidatus Woesearchaeota archaeon]